MATTDTSARPFIVVGVDGSPASNQALRWARCLAAPLGARVDAVAVWHVPAGSGAVAIPSEWDPEGDMHSVLTSAVRDVCGSDSPDGVRLVTLRGNAAQRLLEQGEGATMIILGSRGHGGFAGLLLGSVSAHVAEHAGCPVLVVHGDALPTSSESSESLAESLAESVTP